MPIADASGLTQTIGPVVPLLRRGDGVNRAVGRPWNIRKNMVGEGVDGILPKHWMVNVAGHGCSLGYVYTIRTVLKE